jgi:hypothetical protein
VLKFEGSKEEFPELGIQIIHQNETFTARGVLKSYRLDNVKPYLGNIPVDVIDKSNCGQEKRYTFP